MPEVLAARDWGKRAGKFHPTEAKPADSEVQIQVSKDGRIQQKNHASQGKREGALKRMPHSAERPSSATSKKEREDGIPHPASRKTAQHNSKAWVAQPACNAREKRREQDAQSQPTAVKDIVKQVTMTKERVMSTREGKQRVTMTRPEKETR